MASGVDVGSDRPSAVSDGGAADGGLIEASVVNVCRGVDVASRDSTPVDASTPEWVLESVEKQEPHNIRLANDRFRMVSAQLGVELYNRRK